VAIDGGGTNRPLWRYDTSSLGRQMWAVRGGAYAAVAPGQLNAAAHWIDKDSGATGNCSLAVFDAARSPDATGGNGWRVTLLAETCALANLAIIIGLALILMVMGLRTARELPVEVLPDLSKPTVIILTESAGLSPEEVETRVTQPIESALMGVAGLTRLRTNSDVSLSLVYAEFGWDTDIYKARTLVQERLQGVREQLPDGVQPFMTPVASLMGEILLVGVRSTIKEGEPGYLPPSEVRSIADWTIKRRLQSIPGIAEILNMGGGVKQIEVQPDPYRMQANGVSYEELEKAAAEAASTTTGGFINTGTTEIMVRNLAMTVELRDIASTIVKKVNDRPISIGDVANVVWGIEPMRGDATVSQSPEKTPTYGVIMSITKAPGFDTRALTGEINTALDELKASFPKGVETTLLFQQKDFIDHAINGCNKGTSTFGQNIGRWIIMVSARIVDFTACYRKKIDRPS
jgi:Cu/Ag efflux pump CusA